MAGHLGHTSTPLNQVAAFKDELAREMKGHNKVTHFVGPFSLDDFLKEFLPNEGPEMPEVSAETFSTVTNGRNERDMYDSVAVFHHSMRRDATIFVNTDLFAKYSYFRH